MWAAIGDMVVIPATTTHSKSTPPLVSLLLIGRSSPWQWNLDPF
jgi:hypothetical protein